MRMATRRGLVDVREAAKWLYGEEDDRKRIYKAIERNYFPPDLIVRIGARIFFRASRLERWLDAADGETGEQG